MRSEQSLKAMLILSSLLAAIAVPFLFYNWFKAHSADQRYQITIDNWPFFRELGVSFQYPSTWKPTEFVSTISQDDRGHDCAEVYVEVIPPWSGKKSEYSLFVSLPLTLLAMPNLNNEARKITSSGYESRFMALDNVELARYRIADKSLSIMTIVLREITSIDGNRAILLTAQKWFPHSFILYRASLEVPSEWAAEGTSAFLQMLLTLDLDKPLHPYAYKPCIDPNLISNPAYWTHGL